jgi:hypothetical protein
MLAKVNEGYHLDRAAVPFREVLKQNWQFLHSAPMGGVRWLMMFSLQISNWGPI